MIYVPEKDISYCYVVQSEGVIRAYEETPTYNNTINYRDYYIKSDYIFRDGSQTFNQYSSLPTCLDINLITSEPYYRTDFDSILIIFLIMSIFSFYIPIKIFLRLFRKGNKI